MASKENGGAGLLCSDCHTFENHRVAGRGVDLRVTDLAETVSCTNCHDEHVHDSDRLNNHTARVNCTVCHIPEFARGASGTDMYRDLSDIEFLESKKLWEPVVTRENDVVPEYAFWNGTSTVVSFNEAVEENPATGRLNLAMPQGDIDDDGAQINAFKVHNATQPVLADNSSIVGLKMGVLFQHMAPVDGVLTAWVDDATNEQVVAASIKAGITLSDAAAPGILARWEDVGHKFAETERYMGIFHEVAPADDALACTDCHGADAARIDFEALGYTLKDGVTAPAGFDFLSDHVQDAADCSACHTFQNAQ
jgi:hypothetical protein